MSSAAQSKLMQGLALHRQGRFSGAKSIYESVLKSDPEHFDALHLLGVIAWQTKDFVTAEALIRKAIKINPYNAASHSHLGNTLHGLLRLEDALASFDRAIALNPEYAEAFNNRGIVLKDLGLSRAALASYDTALALKPDYGDARKNREAVLADAKRAEAQAHFHRGVALGNQGRLEEAIAEYDSALAIEPDIFEALGNRAEIFMRQGRSWQALADFDAAVALRPDDAAAHSNRGAALVELGRLDDALDSYDKAIARRPDNVEAHFNRAAALAELKRCDEAIASYDHAIAVDPLYADAYANRGLIHLLKGDFERGLPDNEWRKRRREPQGSREFDKPLWLGEDDLSGKAILVHAEQGLGDTIQFSRYVSLLTRRGAKVLFAPQRPMRILLREMAALCELVDVEDQTLAFDFHCPLLSLPLAFKTRLDTIPQTVPYLRADPERVRNWAQRIGDDGFKIAICWQGSSGKVDAQRSFPLSALHEISKLPNVRLINVHKGAGLHQLKALPAGMTVETFGDNFDSGPDAFLDAAAVIAHCDLVITSDTAIAHLAGALGVPTWVALKYAPDWRWMLERSDSPWYPTMTLFRQSIRGDWTGVFAEIAHALNVRMGHLHEPRTLRLQG